MCYSDYQSLTDLFEIVVTKNIYTLYFADAYGFCFLYDEI